jgi:hypothetical protein
MNEAARVRFREFESDRLGDFRAAGFHDRHFFPHRAFYLPKAAPDGYKLAVRSGLRPQPERTWELVLFARPEAVDDLPAEVFSDDEILWHRQHFGRPGQVAVAGLIVTGARVDTAVHHSDLVQRISRRRGLKTRIEKRFDGWDRMLLNSILAFALERGLDTVRVPTSQRARALIHGRDVQPELFDRIYDRHVEDHFGAHRADEWWHIDVASNRGRFVVGTATSEPVSSSDTTVCICHDIERGLGHRTIDHRFAHRAERSAPDALDAMLTLEDEAGARTTYNVVGSILNGIREPIELAGHCLGFHTFDHDVPHRGRLRAAIGRLDSRSLPRDRSGAYQLQQCRQVDYRIKGYRPAQSRLGADTDQRLLAFHNFEWLASSAASLGTSAPVMDRGIVKIPILLDDFDLHRGKPYDTWADEALEVLARQSFASVSLHDCYGSEWIGRYDKLLRRLQDLGTVKTLDEVAAEVTLAHAA